MTTVLGLDAFRILSKYDVPWVRTVKVDVIDTVQNWKLPFYMKAISSRAVHKTEAKAVVKIQDRDHIAREYSRLRKIGIVVAQPEFKGVELLVGVKDDDVFGKVIACGLGGTFVEVIKDVSFRACPITMKDADSMLKELKGYKVLRGYRGQEVNLQEIKRTLVNVSKLAVKENIRELDINPLIVDKNKAYAVDARIIK